MANKYSINLLQEELFPERPLLTLSRVLMLWGVVLVVMVVLTFSLQTNERILAKESAQLIEDKKQQDQKIDTLKSRLASHKPSAELLAKEQMLKHIINNKKTIYSYLTNSDESYINGFAKAMSDLASMHHKNISLTDIRINENDVAFSGIARTANAVPEWLTNFERSKVLSGRLFNHFQLEENDNKHIEFTVSSSQKKEDE